MDLTIREALRLIAAKSPVAGHEAAKSLHARPQTLQLRYDNVAAAALGDPQAAFTAEERAAIVALLADAEDDRIVIQVRVSARQKIELEDRAAAQGISMSELIRRALFSRDV